MMAFLDSNIWGLLAMPTGVLIGFGAALFVWLRDELRSSPSKKNKDSR